MPSVPNGDDGGQNVVATDAAFNTASATYTVTPGSSSTTYSVTFTTTPASCMLSFDGQAYSDGSVDPSVPAGSYFLTAIECPGEVFSSWASSVGPLGSATAASTTVTVGQSGSLTATYVTGQGYSVTFDIRPGTCRVDFDGETWTNGQVDPSLLGGVYTLGANTCAGYTFASWTVTAGTVGAPTAPATTVDVTANGEIEAQYDPTGYAVTFSVTGGPCSIEFDGKSWTNAQVDSAIPAGTYPLVANACPGYSFLSWTSSAGVVSSRGSPTTSVDISSGGSIGAAFSHTVAGGGGGGGGTNPLSIPGTTFGIPTLYLLGFLVAVLLAAIFVSIKLGGASSGAGGSGAGSTGGVGPGPEFGGMGSLGLNKAKGGGSGSLGEGKAVGGGTGFHFGGTGSLGDSKLKGGITGLHAGTTGSLGDNKLKGGITGFHAGDHRLTR